MTHHNTCRSGFSRDALGWAHRFQARPIAAKAAPTESKASPLQDLSCP